MTHPRTRPNRVRRFALDGRLRCRLCNRWCCPLQAADCCRLFRLLRIWWGIHRARLYTVNLFRGFRRWSYLRQSEKNQLLSRRSAPAVHIPIFSAAVFHAPALGAVYPDRLSGLNNILGAVSSPKSPTRKIRLRLWGTPQY